MSDSSEPDQSGASDEPRSSAKEHRRLADVAARMRSARDARAAELQRAEMVATQSQAAAEGSASTSSASPTTRAFRTGFVGGLGLILAYITYLTVESILDTLILILVAAVLAIGLEPAVQFFMRRKFRRGWAVTTVFAILLAVVIGAGYAIIPPIVSETVTFAESIPKLITDLQNNPTIKNLDEKYQIIEQIKNSDILQRLGGGAAGGLLTAGVAAAGVIFDLFVVLVLALFFLAGMPKIKSAAYRLAPASRRARVRELGDKILKQMGGYLAGAAVVAAQAGIVAGVFAAIVGLPYPWAIGLGAAILDFIPVVGPIIIGISMTLLGFTQSLLIGIIAGLFYVAQHMFEAYWLYPRVMRRQVDISTAAVVVAIIIGSALLGVTGALLAVPVAAAVQLIVREVVIPWQDRS